MEAGKAVAGAREGVLARHGVIMESSSSIKETGEQVSFFILFISFTIFLSNLILQQLRCDHRNRQRRVTPWGAQAVLPEFL